MNKNTIKIGKLKKLELSVIIFLFVLSLPIVSVAQGKLDALRDLKGVFVNLNIINKTPQGPAKKRVNKKELVDYARKEMVEQVGKIRGMQLNKPFFPHLKIKLTLEGQNNTYFIIANASLQQGSSTWQKEHSTTWPTDDYKERMKNAKKYLLERKEQVAAVQMKVKKARSKTEKHLYENEVKALRAGLASREKQLSKVVKEYGFAKTVKDTLKSIINDFAKDCKAARGI